MSSPEGDFAAFHPAHAFAREELLDLVLDPSPAPRKILLQGPAGVGKHHLVQSLKKALPSAEIALCETGANRSSSGLTIWIARGSVADRTLAELPRILLRGFSKYEKRVLAQSSLAPEICTAFELTPAPFLTESVLETLLFSGPRESGWHGFVERLEKLCRRRVRTALTTTQLDPDWIREVLGDAIFPDLTIFDENIPGCVAGLMVSSWGGDIVRVEATCHPGEGCVTMTGAGAQAEQAARLAQLRLITLSEGLDRSREAISCLDWHLHVSGAGGPKDGVSLGLALLVAMASSLLRRPVEHLTAFTGELTLTGALLPVGQLTEKLLGAERAGCRSLLFPKVQQDELLGLSEARLETRLRAALRDEDALEALGLWRRS